MRPARPLGRVVLALLALAPLAQPASARERDGRANAGLQDTRSVQRSFEISARKYAFLPDRIEVDQDDLVKITLQSDDIAHSFTIDTYRIARRVKPGQTTVFEFRADKAGVFPFYCNLAADEGCRKMRGELIVRAR